MGRPRTYALRMLRKPTKMPEYLSFGPDLANLGPDEIAQQLEVQRERLIEAMSSLREAEKIDPKIFDFMVSV